MSRFWGKAVGGTSDDSLSPGTLVAVENGLYPEGRELTLSFLQPCFKAEQGFPCATNGLFRYSILLCLGVSNLSVTSGFRSEGASLATFSVRILVVDDYEPWRHFILTTLPSQPNLQIIAQAVDGLEAVKKAQQLQPDLILLDIGLPTLNGIEAARRIRELSPKSKILFISENRSWDIAQEALRTGARGYLVKSDAAGELLPAVEAVLRGQRFVSASLAGNDLTEKDEQTADHNSCGVVLPFPPQNVWTPGRHEAGFYSDDASLLEGFTQFIGAALRAKNAVIVVATEPHRDALLPRLRSHGLDVAAAIEQGRYIPLDAAATLSTFMVDDLPDPARFFEATAHLFAAAVKASQGEHPPPRVAVCGECDPPLWTLGDGEAAIRFEKLWNEIAKIHDVDILCGYTLSSFHNVPTNQIYQRICAEHSVVYSG